MEIEKLENVINQYSSEIQSCFSNPALRVSSDFENLVVGILASGLSRENRNALFERRFSDLRRRGDAFCSSLSEVEASEEATRLSDKLGMDKALHKICLSAASQEELFKADSILKDFISSVTLNEE